MNWQNHSNLSGKHAYLGASQNAWLNYTPQRMEEVYTNRMKAQEGTELHAIASINIKHRIKVASLKRAFNMFINDAIGFRMDSEQVLYYSDRCFGTADAISFNASEGLLRIHDLKTGERPVVHFNQLDIYSALFCLEYNVDPSMIEIQERLYQGREYTENVPEAQDIQLIMDKIVKFDAALERLANTMAEGE